MVPRNSSPDNPKTAAQPQIDSNTKFDKRVE